MKNICAVDFFCGGGGMSYGLSLAGINVIAGIDIDAECKATYEYNNRGSKFIDADISKMDVDFLETELGLKRDDDNMIFAGCSPCQYYNIINTSKGKSVRTKDLLTNFCKFVGYYKPGYVLVENVPGIATNKDSVLPFFLNFLSCTGYEQIHKKVIDLSCYGVPQSRKRFSLIATRIKSPFPT